MEENTTNTEAVDTTPRTWIHSRKGKIVGYINDVSKDGVWTDIHVTEDGYWYNAGELADVRTTFLTEVK